MWYLAIKYDLLGSKVAFLLSTGKFFVSFEVTLSGSWVPGYINEIQTYFQFLTPCNNINSNKM